MIKNLIVSFLCLNFWINHALPKISYANCEGILGHANFSLYKNKQAIFNSVTNADYEQRYNIEWFIGSKSIGSVTKNGGESFVLEG